MYYIGQATEGGVFLATFAFTDAQGAAVVPDSAEWSLKDRAGAVMNGRSAVSITPAAAVDVLLSGDDLIALDGLDGWRVITIEYTYTSTEGSGLPMSASALFKVAGA